MDLEDTKLDCQIPCLESVAEGIADGPPESFIRSIKLKIRRRLKPDIERKFKNSSNDWLNWLCKLLGRSSKPLASAVNNDKQKLKAGDWVRVLSREEIEATLNHWGQVKGCAFMPEMGKYCRTIQRVLKPMNRFVDERDLRVKKSSGIILLEGVMCEGTAEFGSCDRSCFVFWREEWLEKIDKRPA